MFDQTKKEFILFNRISMAKDGGEMGISSIDDSKNNQQISKTTTCECCPYGFHIDTDFVRYCDALISALYSADSSRSLSSIRRKFRFYDFNPTITSSKVDCLTMPPFNYISSLNSRTKTKISTSTPVTQSPVSNTIVETQSMLKKFIESAEEEEELEEDEVMYYESCSIRGSATASPTPSSSVGTSSTFTKSILEQIRTHLAQSLQRVKVLEAEVEKVPHLQKEISRLKIEKDELQAKLNAQAQEISDKTISNTLVESSTNTEPIILTFEMFQSISIEGTEKNDEEKMNKEQENILQQKPNVVEKRSVGTLTRLAPLVSFRNGQCQTDLKAKDIGMSTKEEAPHKTFINQMNQTEPIRIIDGQSQTETIFNEENEKSLKQLTFEDKSSSTTDLFVEDVQRPASLEFGCSKLTLSSLNSTTSSSASSSSSTSSQPAGTNGVFCDRCSEALMIGSSHSEFSTSTPLKETSATTLLPKSDSGISVVTVEKEHRSTLELQLPSPLSSMSLPRRQLDYQNLQPNNEVKEALRIVNECLHDEKRNGTFIFSKAAATLKRFWFKISGQQTSDARVVEHYLDYFEKYSSNLLTYVVNMADSNGNTAMHYALSCNNFDIVSVLLDSKVANINRYNKAGYTSTMLMSLAKIEVEVHRDVAERFFRQADVNMKAKQNGQTALMLAASHGKLVICNLLLQCEAEVNLQDNDGSTALMCAAEHGHADIIALLLGHPDCDPHLEDNEGSTALKIALINGHNDVGVILYAGIRNQELNGKSSSSLSRLCYSISPGGSPSAIRRGSSGGNGGLSLSNSQITLPRHSPSRFRHASATTSMSMPSSPSKH